MSRISPTLLLVIVILAIGFFLLGLLQLVIRCLMKRPSFSSISQSNRLPDAAAASQTLQRQLQQLFRLHDSGVDQSLIDALPVFYYKDIKGLKEPFDCAVCLSEFSVLDKLKSLPTCTHAFHIHCIETWLLSNSTCPLCRRHIDHVDNLSFNYGTDPWTFISSHGATGSSPEMSLQDNAAPARVFSIRLGKFRSTNEEVGSEIKKQNEVTSSSSSSIDGRRCYSMGAFQYVVGNADLQVALQSGNGVANKGRTRFGREEDSENGEKMGRRIRGDSFSVSKIWLWSKTDRFLNSSEAIGGVSMPNTSNLV